MDDRQVAVLIEIRDALIRIAEILEKQPHIITAELEKSFGNVETQ